MRKTRATVYLVDDDSSIRSSLTRLLKFEGFTVASFSSAEEFLKQSPHKRPGCLVSDVYMPGINGMDLQEECQKRGINLPIIFITGHGKIPMSVLAMKKGAVDFLTKPFDTSEILQVIKQAVEKDRMACDKARLVSDVLQCMNKLSLREREVLLGVISGMLNKQIAVKMNIVEKTVKVHRANVMRKMRADSVPHLVRLASTAGVALVEN